jgi:hypothetical protein
VVDLPMSSWSICRRCCGGSADFAAGEIVGTASGIGLLAALRQRERAGWGVA